MHIMLRRASQTSLQTLPALPIRQSRAARADRFPPYMTARMGKATECRWAAQAGGSGGGGLPRNWLSPAGHSAIQQSPARNSRPRKRAKGLDLASSSDTM